MPGPLLVYDRIDANRRRTRLLLAAFVLAILPFASGATVWLLPMLFSLAMILLLGVSDVLSTWQPASLEQALLAEIGFVGAAFVLATVGLTVATTLFIARYSSRMLLRAARARPATREKEPRLHRTVENLCIGAGLAKPALYVIESSAPNGFATGRTPAQASLVVTRGMLTLLDRRELESVIAHELSHIGNQDIRLNTTLAGLVGTLTLPLRIVLAVLGLHPVIAVIGVLLMASLFSGFAMIAWELLTEGPGLYGGTTGSGLLPSLLWWLSLHNLATPLYMLLLAPLVGRLLASGVARERELLADADAVRLTRNPEAMALALVKVGSARGTRVRAGPATAHMYFVDPIGSGGPWLAELFRSHPPIAERLDLLSRMGSGIPGSAIDDAIRAGVEHRHDEQESNPKPSEGFLRTPTESQPSGHTRSDGDTPASSEETRQQAAPDAWTAIPAGEVAPGQKCRLAEAVTFVYAEPDGLSAAGRLGRGETVTVESHESGFVKVITAGGSAGYIGRHIQVAATTKP